MGSISGSRILRVVIAGDAKSLGAATAEGAASLEGLSAKAATAGQRISAGLAKVGAASALVATVIAVKAVKAAEDYEAALERVHTQAGLSQKDTDALGKKLLTLSPKVGVGPEALATSLYHVASAGFDAAQSINIVTAAAKLSRIGNADIENTTQAIIGIMASGIKGVKDANDAAALLNTTVGTGDMKLEDLAESIGSGILPIAKTLGLSFEDVSAAAATMTDNVTKPQVVMTRLKTALQTLVKPTPQQVAAFGQIGMSALQLANDFQKPNGLLVAVNDLKTNLNKVYPEGQTTKLTLTQIKSASDAWYKSLVAGGENAKDATKDTKAYTDQITQGGTATVLAGNNIVRALGGSKTAGVFLTLMDESGRLTQKYQQQGDATTRAAKLQEAWNATQATYKQKLADVKAAWDVLLVQIGNKILPYLKQLADYLAKHPKLLQDAAIAVGVLGAAWVAVKVGGLVTSLASLAAQILGVGAASTAAAAETEAANLGGAVGGAASAGGAGAAARMGALRLIVPLAITYVALKETGTYNSVSDLLHGQFTKAGADAPKWAKALATEIDGGLQVAGKIKLLPQFDPNVLHAANEAVGAFHQNLVDLQTQVDATSKSLIGNSAAAMGNRQAVTDLATKAVLAAKAYATSTGNAADYGRALALSVPQIEASATAIGLNKSQVDALVHSVQNAPAAKAIRLSVPGMGALDQQVEEFLEMLDRIPAQKTVDVQVQTYGSASAAAIANATRGSGHGAQANGGVYPAISSGKPGGIFQWAEAGGESFIPHSLSKRKQALDIWAKTGQIIGAIPKGNVSTASVGLAGAPSSEGGDTYITNVTVHVAGSAVSERKLVTAVQQGIQEDLKRKGKPYSFIK